MVELTVSETADARIDILRRFDILDTLPESSFGDLAMLAATVTQMPYASICFIDRGRNWVKASFGAELESLPTELGPCNDLLAQPSGSTKLIAAKIKTKSGQTEPIPEIPGVKTWIAAPILCQNKEHLLGAVCVFDTADSKLTEAQSDALLAIGRQVTNLLQLRQSAASLELATVKMQVLIDRDSITGLPTERVFRGHLRTEFQYARRHGQPLSLVIAKLNQEQLPARADDPEIFDDIIKKLARILGRDTREYDLIARSSENEFAIVMRNATYEIGVRVAGRLQSRIAASEIHPAPLPIQFAVSSLTPDMVSSRDLINKALAEFAEAKVMSVA